MNRDYDRSESTRYGNPAPPLVLGPSPPLSARQAYEPLTPKKRPRDLTIPQKPTCVAQSKKLRESNQVVDVTPHDMDANEIYQRTLIELSEAVDYYFGDQQWQGNEEYHKDLTELEDQGGGWVPVTTVAKSEWISKLKRRWLSYHNSWHDLTGRSSRDSSPNEDDGSASSDRTHPVSAASERQFVKILSKACKGGQVVEQSPCYRYIRRRVISPELMDAIRHAVEIGIHKKGSGMLDTVSRQALETGKWVKLKVIEPYIARLPRVVKEGPKEFGKYSLSQCLAFSLMYSRRVRLNEARTEFALDTSEPLPPTQRRFVRRNSSDEIVHVERRGNLRVLQYNILADKLCSRATFPWTHPDDLVWSRRRFCILRKIRSHDPDVICLQEMQVNQTKWFEKQLLKMGFAGQLACRSPSNIKDELCVLIAWKEKYYKKVAHDTIKMNHITRIVPEDHSKKFDKNQVAVFVALDALHHGRPLIICTTHISALYAQPDVQIAQICYMLRRLKQFCAVHRKRGVHPAVLVTGDFNTTPESQAYRLITEGRIPGELFPTGPFHEPTHSLNLVSVNEAVLGSEFSFTTYTLDRLFCSLSGFRGCLDYIFYDKDSLAPLSVLEPVPLAEVQTEKAWPSRVEPSDHIALVADFDFAKLQVHR